MKRGIAAGLLLATCIMGAQAAATVQTARTQSEQSFEWGKWVYVQSDKAVQYRVAKVGEEGDVALLRYQLRVELGNDLACYSDQCEGYILYLQVFDPVASDFVATRHLFFPRNSSAVYDLPEVIRFPVRTSPTGRRFLDLETGLPMYELFSEPGTLAVTEVIQGCVDDIQTGYSDTRCRDFDPSKMVRITDAQASPRPAPIADRPREPTNETALTSEQSGGGVNSRPLEAEKAIPEYERRYQEELAIYNQRLAERKARLDEIEQIKAEQEARLARAVAKAQEALGRHEEEMELHRQKMEQAQAAQRRYEQELAAQQAATGRSQEQTKGDQPVDWREALVVCTLNSDDGQSQFGNWRCDGPLQFTYAKLGESGGSVTRGALVALSQACGGQPESVRDLGLVNGHRAFGCSFGLHPQSSSGVPLDAAKKYGLSYVPGRAIYRCPASKSACRSH